MKSIIKADLQTQIQALKKKEYSSVELTKAYLARIEEIDPQVNSFVLLNTEAALQAAAASDARRQRGETLSALDGIPFAAKDNFCTKGLRTTCASKMLENYVPPYDATAVLRLQNAGAILLGKLNMDEFAMGSTGEQSIFGASKNPLALGRVTGGSSSGSAAAVAAREIPFALGSDTGGSVRQPAAFCGVLGFKPTYGAISRYGLIEFASSLDCVGILAQNAADCKTVFAAIAGKDEKDATTIVYPTEAPLLPDRPLRIAVVKELLENPAIDRDVSKATQRAIELFEKSGAIIDWISLPSPQTVLAAYCVLSATEASSNLARYDGIRYGRKSQDAKELFSLYANSRAEGLGEEVKRRLLFGSCILTKGRREIYLNRAEYARQEIKQRLEEVFSHYDLILNPTTPTAAFLQGESLSQAQKREADLCTVYANLAGLPAVSVPFGKSAEGLPLGVHLMAAPCKESLLLYAARRLEAARE